MALNVVNTRNTDKRFKCDTCGKGFIHNIHLTIHVRIHTGEKPYKCDTCGAHFSQSGSLKAHVRDHTGEKPYKCDTCGIQFTDSGHLKNHIRVSILGINHSNVIPVVHNSHKVVL